MRLLRSLLLVVLLGAFATTVVVIQNHKLKQVNIHAPFQDTYSLDIARGGAFLRAAALGYDLVVADFMWLRAIQSFGGRGMTLRDWRPVYSQFDAITELDPRFEQAYTFGNLVIGDEGGQQREGLRLLNKGMENLIYLYRIPYEAMYVAHWTLKDTNLARWYGRIASKRQDAPDWVPRVVAYLDVESGQYYIGLDRFIGNLLDGVAAEDGVLMRLGINKVGESIRKWHLEQLHKAFEELTSATGKMPSSISELASAPSLQDYETASMARVLAMVSVLAEKAGKPAFIETVSQLQPLHMPTPEQVTEAETLTTAAIPQSGSLLPFQNEILRHALVKTSGLPTPPEGGSYAVNLALAHSSQAQLDKIIQSPNEINEFLQGMLAMVRQEITKRQGELGRYPVDLKEVFYTDFVTPEPLGGRWIYSPLNGEFKSSSRPEL